MQKLILLIVTAATLAAFTLASRPQAPPKARIGTYDSRAIAIAYAPSKHNPVTEKMKEHEAAKAKGDTQRVKELEAWGTLHQRQLHRQGFARVPVDDLLAPVADRLPEVAQAAGVDAIVFGCNQHTADVELVDVTLAIVALYEPSEQTLEYVRSAMKAQPVPLDTIDKLKD
jgi:hypothetical protein